ncbi:MAG: hypothetical protein AAGD11_15770 [Planctomycetota bacterium]
MRGTVFYLPALVLWLFLVAIGSSAQSQPSSTPLTPAFTDNMDDGQTALRLLSSGDSFRLLSNSIDRRTYQNGAGAARIHLRGPAGHTAEIGYAIGRAPVIQELQIRTDLVSSRAGVRLAARIVLPRSINPSTGQPFALLVRGTSVGAGRNWERLSLDDLPQKLANHARVARSQHRTALDERGAYVSHVIFLTPGGSGVTELIVDRVQVYGVVQNPPTAVNSANAKTPTGSRPIFQRNDQQRRAAQRQKVRIPRVIQWQGEPFEFLQQLGFNTIGMDRMPTDAELRQAERLGVALFCPPPSPLDLDKGAITDEHNSVLAWNLGDQLSVDDLAHVERWERLVTRYDPISTRPTVLAPQLNTLEASRVTDVILIGRPAVGADVSLREHSAWLAQRQHLARPGTPTWTKIETQPSRRQRLQIAALSSAEVAAGPTSYHQLCGLVSAAFGVKSRGFYFTSQKSLDSTDPATQRRAMAATLTNLRIQLAEPWLLAGKEVSSARASRPDLSALVLQAERSHLLVPVWWQQNMQASAHPRSDGPVSFVVPGVAESSEAFLVTVGGIQRVRHRRVTGGIRISLDQLPIDGYLLLSDDPQAIAQVTGYVRRVGPRAARLQRDLVSMQLQEVSSVTARLGSANNDPALMGNLAATKTKLAECDQYLKSRSFALAYLSADAGSTAINEVQKQLSAEQGRGAAPQGSSISHAWIPLPDQLDLQRTLSRAPLSTNLLRGGGFEDLASLLEYGWRHKQLTIDGITTAVRLSPAAPHSGTYCLELEARAIDPSAPTTIVPTAPVWISSSPLSVRRGDLLEITGVARVAEPVVGSIDGLQIIDSLGGVDLALRIQDAPTWQPFKLIRAATSDTEVTVTIALSGLGKAQVDDVALRVVRK